MIDMIKRSLAISFLSIFILLSLFAKTVTAPEWISNKNAVFPSETYISGLGEGKSKEAARNDAIAEVSRYLKTSVENTVQAKTNADSINGKSNFSQRLEESTTISSTATLSGLNFSEPYHDKKEKCWYCVAYIKRDDAWNLLLPRIESAKAAFYALYDNGRKETEPVFKYSFFAAALEKGVDFQDVLDYARIIHPKNEEGYLSDREAINSVQNLLITEKGKCTLFLALQGDYGNILTEAATKIFSETPFSLVGSEKSANYKATVTVDDNKVGDNPLSISPSAKIEIKSKSGRSVYADVFRLETKTTAYSLEKAQKKAYSQIADVMKQELPEKLAELFNKNGK